MRVEVRNASCGYGDRTVVGGVSLEVQTGEAFCLLGPNGSGKTTLFKAILGLLNLTEGEILLDGENICAWSRSQMARAIGYIPQSHSPSFPFSVLDVVLMGRMARLGLFGSPSKRDLDVSLRAIDTLSISHLVDRTYTEISGGERQLVLMARALAQEPRILIMDEPTSNLDLGNQVMVLRHIGKLVEEGLSVILTTHFPNHAFLCASKVALMHNGGVIMIGKPEEAITASSLERVFGVQTKIVDVGLDGDGEALQAGLSKVVRVCVPMVH